MHTEIVEEKLGVVRSRLHRAHLGSGKATQELAAAAGCTPAELGEVFSGRRELTVALLLRLAHALEKPLWWFLGERPEGITLEEAETSLKNLERVRLLVEALESQFYRVTGGPASSHESVHARSEGKTEAPPARVGEVVDLAFYRARARAILERENRTPNPDLDEESIEMIAHGLYNAERLRSSEERGPRTGS